MAGQSSEQDSRWLLVVLVVPAVALFVYPLFLGTPLLDPDEGLHASIAQEMVERGDWVTPRSLGQPFLDKPILYFWSEALSLKIFGMNEAAVRLPGILFGLLGVATTVLVATRLFGRRTGLLAAMCYATMILPTAMVQSPAHDVALVPWVNLAIWLFWESDRAVGFRSQARFALAIGTVLGLAILTKGLVGVALIGVVYGSYLLLTRQLTLAACLRGVAALAVAAGIASIWYVAMEIRNPGYLYYYFVERHLLGYVTETQRHGKSSPWFYLPILLGGGLPWIAYLPVLVRDWWAGRAEGHARRNGPLTLAWCWLIAGTALLSAAQSKMVTYIWPVFPAVAILAAVAWSRLLAGELTPAARRLLAATYSSLCLTGPAMLPVTMLVLRSKYHIQFSYLTWGLAVGVAFSSWIPLGFWRSGRLERALALGTVSICAQFILIMTVIVPYVARVNTARDLASHFNTLGELPQKLLLVDDRIGSLVFYLTPELRRQLRPEQIEVAMATEVLRAPISQAGTVVAVAERRLQRLNPKVSLRGAPFERAGQYRIYTPAVLADRRSEARETTSPATQPWR